MQIITHIQTLKDIFICFHLLENTGWWSGQHRKQTYILCHEFGRSQGSKQNRKQFPRGGKCPSSCKAISAATLQRILHNHNSDTIFQTSICCFCHVLRNLRKNDFLLHISLNLHKMYCQIPLPHVMGLAENKTVQTHWHFSAGTASFHKL